MKLNSISVGGGLALVAAALLANAAASLVGSPEQFAHADDLKRAGKLQPVAYVPVPSADEGGMRRVMDGTPASMPMGGSGGGCVIEGEPLNWFGAIRLMPSCLYPNDLLRLDFNLTPADVDGNGRLESFKASGSALIPAPGEYVDSSMLRLVSTRLEGAEVIVERSSVIETEWLASWVQEHLGFTRASLTWEIGSGWHDIDDDGDLDLIVAVSGSIGPSMSMVFIWLENTGFEKQTFAAGDINQDGEVDGVDISILLSDWSY